MTNAEPYDIVKYMEKDATKWKCTHQKCGKKAYVNFNSVTDKGIEHQYFCIKHFYGYVLYAVDFPPLLAEAYLERDKNPKKAD